MNKKQLIAVLFIIVLVLLSIVLPLAITNKVVSNDRREELIGSRIPWTLELSYELYNVNGTTLCGCNYTDSILMVNASLSEWDNHSRYALDFNDIYAGKFFSVYISPIHPYVHKIRLNATSLINGKEIYRNPFFNNWTEEYDIFLHERFSVDFKVICWWHWADFMEDTQVATFSISNLL